MKLKPWFLFLGMFAGGVCAASEFDEVLAAPPTVCAVGREYQIMVPVKKPTLMWCEVGGRIFYDESNGIVRSDTKVHRLIVPQELLDKARRYKLFCREVRERKVYFTETGPELSREYAFRPIAPDARDIRLYHLADAHSMIEPLVKAAGYWGDKLDLLIMNGDMMLDCGKMEYLAAPYQISGTVTRGEIPVICTRGNHDLRGFYAERYADITPSYEGKTYYTFRLGPIWGVVLDCGEDKPDTNAEYGYTSCCAAFRKRQTAYLEALAKRPAEEFDAPGVRFKLVVCHVPFVYTPPKAPFNIESNTYSTWCRILREKIRPDVILSGHWHKIDVIRPGDPKDHNGAPCPVIVGSEPDRKKKLFTGAAIELMPKSIGVWFTDQDKKVVRQDKL